MTEIPEKVIGTELPSLDDARVYVYELYGELHGQWECKIFSVHYHPKMDVRYVEAKAHTREQALNEAHLRWLLQELELALK